MTGSALGSAALTLTSGSGASKTVTVNVYDPLILALDNGLQIKYTDTYNQVYDDSYSGGYYDIAFWNPVDDQANGWYSVGSVITNGYSASANYSLLL